MIAFLTTKHKAHTKKDTRYIRLKSNMTKPLSKLLLINSWHHFPPFQF